MRRFLHGLGFGFAALMLAAFRCPGPDPLADPNPSGGAGGQGGDGGGFAGAPGVGGDGGTECIPTADGDEDNDGWTETAGDCDDCDPDVHPGAAELPLQPGDENCNGLENEEPECEPDMNGTAIVPWAAARVIDICDPPEDRGWGLEFAQFTHANGDPVSGDNPMQILPAAQFGPSIQPQVGNRMLVMSTGLALPGSCGADTCSDQVPGHEPPEGYPHSPPGCGVVGSTIYNDVALEVSVQPPPNATGFAFHTTFLTHEYPQFVCSLFGDQFLALQVPKPEAFDTDNLVFDKYGIPPSVNFRPFQHCNPEHAAGWCGGGLDPSCPELPNPYCPAGPGLLLGTGFESSSDPNNPWPGGAATHWLNTVVPLTDEGPVKLRFTVFNTGDYQRDSTAIIDGFTWLGDPDLPEQPDTE